MLRWLRAGLSTANAAKVSADNLGIIIENGRTFVKMYRYLIGSNIECDNATVYKNWCTTPVTPDMWQLFPLDMWAVSYPARYLASFYHTSLDLAGTHKLVKLFEAHPYMTGRAHYGNLRFIVFGDTPDTMLIMSVYTAETRMHKGYVNESNTWVYVDGYTHP